MFSVLTNVLLLSLSLFRTTLQAMKQGADCIECDVILTQDGVPICRHDLTLEVTTDVGSRPEFAHKRKTRMVEGKQVSGFFAVDFTLSEIKRLRALQRMDFRDPNYNGQFEVATLQEQIDLVLGKDKGSWDDERNNKKVPKTCLYPEVSSHFLDFFFRSSWFCWLT